MLNLLYILYILTSLLFIVYQTVMSLEPYCLVIRYQSSKRKQFKTRHYGLEELNDIIFPQIIRDQNIAHEASFNCGK